MQMSLLQPPTIRMGLLLIVISFVGICQSADSQRPPNIIFILADDLGFNDVGFRGSAQIPTPNIDALAYSGVILNRYYVNPICTPSRSALMTGKYPIHTGMQHTVLYAAEPRGLPLDLKILPQYLNDLGYTSHIAGKWHLGHWKKVYTPLYRGFSSHIGFWSGHHDYNDHTAVEHGYWGLDMRNGTDVAYNLHGQPTTDVITKHSLNVIASHNATKGPLFLYVAHAAVHSGNPYNPLPANDDIVSKLSHITKYKRRKYAGLVMEMDDSVGKIVAQLQKYHMLENSIIVFSTDNGGPVEGFNSNFASNFPLRGTKNTLWEGGVLGAALVWSPRLTKLPRLAEQTMHISDWLPTLVEAAGGKQALGNFSAAILDGMSLWSALVNDSISPRKSILHNIDNIWGSSAITVDEWKLVNGTNYNGAWDGWYGMSELRHPSDYNWDQVTKCVTGQAIQKLKMLPSRADQIRLRRAATLTCQNDNRGAVCNPLISPCLFHLAKDPCEKNNLAKQYPKVLELLLKELQLANATAVPPSNKPDDPRGNPRLWNYTWTNFGDYSDSKNNIITNSPIVLQNCI
ncbi:arylsulfatase B [Drosophila albomicans]|uniref:Arylsulfatase B n=1 Tax=Drosophila albomicans TaxID=7291 RepID=A0A6P8X231_DROAB|nr:arylsulfatase B [Drosophila albomicans]XP_034105175.1 arylsulfatase B [Drosophila albomicans]